MDSDFMLPVSFEEKEIELPAKAVQFGYVVKLDVEITGQKSNLFEDLKALNSLIPG